MVLVFLAIGIIGILVLLLIKQIGRNFITGRKNEEEFLAIVHVGESQKGTFTAELRDEIIYQKEHTFQEGGTEISFPLQMKQRDFLDISVITEYGHFIFETFFFDDEGCLIAQSEQNNLL